MESEVRGTSSENKPHKLPSRPLSMPRDPTYAYADGYVTPRALTGLSSRSLVVLCAEPDMGKTHVAALMQRDAKDQGMRVFRKSFADGEAGGTAQRLVRACRDIQHRLQPGDRPFMVLDGIAPGDESETASEARAIERLVGSGCQVLVCIRPECEQLLDELSDHLCLRGEDLLYRQNIDETCPSWNLTGGIPPLVEALREDERAGATRGTPGPRYASALAVVVERMVRQELSDEEQRIRLAMLLLGSGTVNDIALVAGRCDVDMLTWLERDVPLLGIDLRERTFRCLGISSEDLLRECFAPLQAHVARFPAIAVRASGLLATRGDVLRSALVCRLCANESDLAFVGCAWGVAYASVGEVHLVEESLRIAESAGMPRDTRAVLAKLAVVSLVGTARNVDDLREAASHLSLSTSTEVALHHRALLLSACRDTWRNPCKTSGLLATGHQDAIGMACLEHVGVARLLASGRPHEAYARLSNEMSLTEPRSIPEALLCDDLFLALTLAGGVPDERERGLFEAAGRLYARVQMTRLRLYHAAFEIVPEVLMGGRRDPSVLEDALVRAEQAGDGFCQALFLGAAAICDVRAQAFSRAHVRAQTAVALARALGEGYLASAAELVDVVVQHLLGEHGVLASYCERRDHPADLALLGRVAALAAGELAGADRALPVPLGTPCPQESLWALRFLLQDCLSISESLPVLVPESWLGAMRVVGERQVVLFGKEGGTREPIPLHPKKRGRRRASLHDGEQAEIVPVDQQDCRIRVSILGGIGVRIDGKALPDGVFDRRRARDLIGILAVAPMHRIRRYQAIEILWPDSDYFRGPRKLYEATGEVRKILGGAIPGANPVMADRAQGTVGFDPALVACDVDDFEREARMTLAEDGDDFWVLDHARRMERLYAGGPDSHLMVLGQQMVDRLEELTSLYVDGVIAAGEAALRLGKSKQAVRFSMDAHRLRPLREDAMMLLVQALRAAGRGFEVAGLYRRYAKRLMDEQGVPPSLALRRLVEMADGERGTLSA